MRNFLNRFRQLQWKLTLSYTLVSVAAILIFEILATFALIQLLMYQADSKGPVFLQEIATNIAPLVKEEADWETFDHFFYPAKKRDKDSAAIIGEFYNFTFTIDANSGSEKTRSSNDSKKKENFPNSPFLIVNSHFEPLYSVAEKAELRQSIDNLSKQERAILLQSMSEARQIKKRNYSSVIIAQPVIVDNQVVGAILASFKATFAGIVTDIFPALLRLLLVLTIIIAIVGSIFGYVSSKWLLRRFNKIQDGSKAWRQGDFDFRIDSSAKDELGKLSRNLNNMAEEIQDLMKNRQELATLEERQRLARELHDSVKQQVFASGMQIAAVKLKTDEESPTIKHLDAAETLIHQAQEELTTLIHKLMPVALEGKGLVSAVREHIEAFQENEEIIVDFQSKNSIKVSSELEYALFRIIQEAFANIAKHSQASKVSIGLEQTQSNLILIIEDNGIGFKTSKKTRGIGLISMQERLEPFAGKLEIESKPGSGTKLTITIPNKGAKDVTN